MQTPCVHGLVELAQRRSAGMRVKSAPFWRFIVSVNVRDEAAHASSVCERMELESTF